MGSVTSSSPISTKSSNPTSSTIFSDSQNVCVFTYLFPLAIRGSKEEYLCRVLLSEQEHHDHYMKFHERRKQLRSERKFFNRGGGRGRRGRGGFGAKGSERKQNMLLVFDPEDGEPEPMFQLEGEPIDGTTFFQPDDSPPHNHPGGKGLKMKEEKRQQKVMHDDVGGGDGSSSSFSASSSHSQLLLGRPYPEDYELGAKGKLLLQALYGILLEK